MFFRIKFFDSDSLKLLHSRVFFSILIFIFVYFISIYRISSIMLLPDIENETIRSIKKDIRGNILDRSGNIIATSINSISLSVNPNKIKNKKELAYNLSSILNLNIKKIEKKLLSTNNFIWIKRNITPIEHQKIINLGEINIKSHKENKRIYPYKNTLSHIVGHVDIDQKGQNGIERFFETELSKSKDIFISIDVNLQQIVRDKLLKTINDYKAESGLAVVMDINSGQILSSVSLPDYDPQNKSSFNQNNLINRVFQSNFEMGSTFKPIIATMGFDLDIIDPNMTFDVKKKYLNIGDHDKYKDNGIYNIEKIIVESSNIGIAQIATLIGKKNQIKFFEKIGFNKKINIENKEISAPLGNKNNWGKVETATIGFGHGFAITPLHLVKAYATLANNGIEVSPTLQLKQNYLRKKILNKTESSSFFINLLNSVVLKTEYTGPRVRVEGYSIGGKTGTSELLNPKGGYFKDRNLTSFIGIFPTNNPKYVVYTAIEYPKKQSETNQRMTGARVNAPLVKDIIINIINLFNISKDESEAILKVDTNFLYTKLNATI